MHLAFVNKVLDLLSCLLSLVKIGIEVLEGRAEVVNLFIVGKVLIVHKSVDHVIMSIFELSVVSDILYNLLRLYVSKQSFLRLNEQVKSLQLLLHVVYRIVYHLVYFHELMVVRDTHLRILESMFLEAVIT